MLGLLVACAATSCESDDDGYKAPEAVQKALLARYPDATRINWKQQNGYEKADFERPDSQLPGGYSDCSAWFDGSGDWYMTESEIAVGALPQAVRAAFNASEYAAWRIEEVERIERKDMETLYSIEAEGRSATGAESDVELYYTADGILVRTVVDRDDDEVLLPEALPEAVRSYIAANYPNARIVEIGHDQTQGLRPTCRQPYGRRSPLRSMPRGRSTTWTSSRSRPARTGASKSNRAAARCASPTTTPGTRSSCNRPSRDAAECAGR